MTMNAVMKHLDRFVGDADGFEGIEYAVMTALIVGAILAALISLGFAVNTQMGDITAVVQN